MSAIRNRIEKNLKSLEPWAAKFQLEAYRVYDRDIPEYPFIVDRYGAHFVVFDRSEEIDLRPERAHHFAELLQALRDVFAVSDDFIIVKRRERHSHKEDSQYEKIADTDERQVIHEGPAQFYVNLRDYLDTGLFLDHRIMRDKVMKLAAKLVRERSSAHAPVRPRVLNLFSYTGSVSVFAALGGAETVSVDLSKNYTLWAQDNFELNKIDLSKHAFVNESALDYCAQPARATGVFEIIFCDPPTFSNSKKMITNFEVERDQVMLIEGCLQRLAAGGVLYFSNNKRSFRLDPLLTNSESPARVRNITSETIPKDFRDQKIHHVFEIKHSSRPPGLEL